MKLRFLFTLLSLLTTMQAMTQVKVVKDSVSAKYGLMDINGHWIQNPIYAFLVNREKGFHGIKKGNPSGGYTPDIFFDTAGTLIGSYDYVAGAHFRNQYQEGSCFLARKGGQGIYEEGKLIRWDGGITHILNDAGYTLISFRADYVSEPDDNGFMIVRLNDRKSANQKMGKYGMFSYTGRMILAIEYDDIIRMGFCGSSRNYYVINKGGGWEKTINGWHIKGGLWGIVDPGRNFVLEPKYSSINSTYTPHLFKVSVNGSQTFDKPKNFQEPGCQAILPHRYVLGARWGIIDSSGKEIIEPSYTYLRQYYGWYSNHKYVFVASRDTLPLSYFFEQDDQPSGIRLGMLSANGRELSEFIYTFIIRKNDTLFAASKDSRPRYNMRWGDLDWQGREITQFIYKDMMNRTAPVDHYSEERINIMQDTFSGRYGLKKKGTWILKPNYAFIYKAGANYVASVYQKVQTQKYPKVLFDSNGIQINSFEDLVSYQDRRQVFFIGNNGGKLVKKKGRRLRVEGGSNFIVDFSGKEIKAIPGDFVKVVDDSGYIVFGKKVGRRVKYGLMKYDGSLLVEAKYDELQVRLYCEHNPYYWLSRNEKLWGVIIPSTKAIVEPVYSSISSAYFRGIFKVSKGGTADCDANKEPCVEVEACSGRNVRFKGARWGYLDSSGKEFVPARYTYIEAYSYNSNIELRFFIASKDSILKPFRPEKTPLVKLGLISPSGRELTSFKYSFISCYYADSVFIAGTEPVNKYYEWDVYDSDIKRGYLDWHGKELTTFIYSYLSCRSSDLILYKFAKGEKYGIMNRNLTYRTDTIYKNFYYLNDSLYALKDINNKYALVNKFGISLSHFKYDTIIKVRPLKYQAEINSFLARKNDSCFVLNTKGEERFKAGEDSLCFNEQGLRWHYDTSWRIQTLNENFLWPNFRYIKKVASPRAYSSLYPPKTGFNYGWYLVNTGGQVSGDSIVKGKWGLYDIENGTFIIQVRYDKIELTYKKNKLEMICYLDGRKEIKQFPAVAGFEYPFDKD